MLREPLPDAAVSRNIPTKGGTARRRNPDAVQLKVKYTAAREVQQRSKAALRRCSGLPAGGRGKA
jgi:hypothetical protein